MYTREAYLVIGRFQGFTKKHSGLIWRASYDAGTQTLIKSVSGPQVVVGIVHGGMSSENTKVNPFSFRDRVWMIRQSHPEAMCVKLPTAFLGDAQDVMYGLGYELTRIYVGADREETYRRQIERYKYNIEVDVLERDPLVSGTELRNSLKDENLVLFRKLSPQELHRHYAKIKEMYVIGRGWKFVPS